MTFVERVIGHLARVFVMELRLLKAVAANPVSWVLIAVVLVHAVPYWLDPHGFRSIPGPFLAKFSNVWIGWVTAQGHRSEVVHELHLKYGTSITIYILIAVASFRR